MTFTFKYYFIYFIASFILLCLMLFCISYRFWSRVEPFHMDWNPITDPNHVESHQNEIIYLSDWISILDRGNKSLESQQLKAKLKQKQRHLQWHLEKKHVW